jgi:hypothetical protein
MNTKEKWQDTEEAEKNMITLQKWQKALETVQKHS